MNETVKKERAEMLAEHIARQVFNLALDYLPKIEKAGSESDKGEAKVTFSSSWPALHHSPQVVTKMSFSSSTKDETESRVHLDGQEEMNFESSEPQKPEPLQIEGEVLDADGWVSTCDRLPDDETQVEIESVEGEKQIGCFKMDHDYGETMFFCDAGGVFFLGDVLKWRPVPETEAEPSNWNEHGVCLVPDMQWRVCGDKKTDKIRIELYVAEAPDGGFRIGHDFNSDLPDLMSGSSAPCKLDGARFPDSELATEALQRQAEVWLNQLAEEAKAPNKKKIKAALQKLEEWFNSFYSADEPWPMINDGETKSESAA